MKRIRNNTQLFALITLCCFFTHNAMSLTNTIGRFDTSSIAISTHDLKSVSQTKMDEAALPGILLAAGVGLALAGLAAAFVVGVVDGVRAGLAAGESLAMIQQTNYQKMDFSKFDQ